MSYREEYRLVSFVEHVLKTENDVSRSRKVREMIKYIKAYGDIILIDDRRILPRKSLI